MRRWQGVILIVLTMLAITAAGYADRSAEQVDKIAPPVVETASAVEWGDV